MPSSERSQTTASGAPRLVPTRSSTRTISPSRPAVGARTRAVVMPSRSCSKASRRLRICDSPNVSVTSREVPRQPAMLSSGPFIGATRVRNRRPPNVNSNETVSPARARRAAATAGNSGSRVPKKSKSVWPTTSPGFSPSEASPAPREEVNRSDVSTVHVIVGDSSTIRRRRTSPVVRSVSSPVTPSGVAGFSDICTHSRADRRPKPRPARLISGRAGSAPRPRLLFPAPAGDPRDARPRLRDPRLRRGRVARCRGRARTTRPRGSPARRPGVSPRRSRGRSSSRPTRSSSSRGVPSGSPPTGRTRSGCSGNCGGGDTRSSPVSPWRATPFSGRGAT